MNKQDKAIPMVIYSLEKMHFKVKVLPDEQYSVLAADGLNVFGSNYNLKAHALRYFEDCAYRYKRRNGLKKLQEYLPKLVAQIKNNRWLCGD